MKKILKDWIPFFICVIIIIGFIIAYNVRKSIQHQKEYELVETVYETLLENEGNLYYENAYVEYIENGIWKYSTLDDVKGGRSDHASLRQKIVLHMNSNFDRLNTGYQGIVARDYQRDIEKLAETIRNDSGLAPDERLPMYYKSCPNPIWYNYDISIMASDGDLVYVSCYSNVIEYSRYAPNTKAWNVDTYKIVVNENGRPSSVKLMENEWSSDSKDKDTSNKTGSSSSTNQNSSSFKDDPYDVHWYDDPDDFAGDWADEFDSYDDAYDYWEDEN